jgi:hypothetical protein
MALADAKGDILIDGNRYILMEETYREPAQKPFNPRFSSGDPALTDLSFWQMAGQDGFRSEGQDKFTEKDMFRQSAGWDFRDGRARIGHGIESLTPAASVPVPYSAVGVVTLDAMVTSVLNTSLWNDGVSGNAALLTCSDATYGARSGYLESDGAVQTSQASGNNTLGADFGAYANILASYVSSAPALTSALTAIPARGSAISFTNYLADLGTHTGLHSDAGVTSQSVNLHAYSSKSQQIYQMGMHGLTLQSVGDFVFSFEVRHNNTGIHAGVGFMLSTLGGGYVLEFSDAGGTTVKLFKTTKATAWDNTGDTLLKTWTISSCYNAKSIIKVSVAGSNIFSLYQDGVLNGGGTVTDATYTVGDCFRFTTAYAAAGETTIGVISVPGPAGSASGVTGKFVHYNNKLYVGYNANTVSDFTFTNLITASHPANLPGITHIKCRDLCVWNRDSDPTGALNSITAKNTFLCVLAGTTLNIYSGTTLAYTQTVNSTGCLIVPIDSSHLLIVGTSAENTGLITIDRLKFTANTFTLAETKTCHLDGGVSGSIVNSYAFDSNGVLFIATYDMSGTTGSMPSRLIQITATDILATNLTVSAVSTIADMTIRGLVAMNGTVYLFGALIEGNYAYAAVVKSSGEKAYKSIKGIQIEGGSQGNLFNFGIPSLWQGFRGVRFLSQTSLDLWDPILNLDLQGNVLECAAFDSGLFNYDVPNVVAIAEWNGRFYCLNAQAGTIKRTLTTRGGLGSSFDDLVLELSAMGSNTPAITKSLYSAIIELSEALPADETWTIKVNNTAIGTLTSDDGTRKEIALTAEMTASTFSLKVVAPQDSTWSGYLSVGPLIKFVPTQFKKRSWGFGIRLDRNLKFADGTRESRTPAEIWADLKTSWQSNIPLTFVDVDGTSYSVLMADAERRRPLLNRDGGSKLEGFAFIELLEV